MSKKPGKFAAVYKKTSAEFKRPWIKSLPEEVSKRGRCQDEVDYLVNNLPQPDGKVSYPHETVPYTKADQISPPGTAHVTRKGKVVKKG